MPDKPVATGLAKGALVRGIVSMACDIARQCVRQAPSGWRHSPAVRSESIEGSARIAVLCVRGVRGERIGDGAGDHAC